jgi:hypothetical protein
MDKSDDQKVFILVGFFTEKPFKFKALITVLKPALVIEFDDGKIVIFCMLDWRSPPLLGVRDPSERQSASESVGFGAVRTVVQHRNAFPLVVGHPVTDRRTANYKTSPHCLCIMVGLRTD